MFDSSPTLLLLAGVVLYLAAIHLIYDTFIQSNKLSVNEQPANITIQYRWIKRSSLHGSVIGIACLIGIPMLARYRIDLDSTPTVIWFYVLLISMGSFLLYLAVLYAFNYTTLQITPSNVTILHGPIPSLVHLVGEQVMNVNGVCSIFHETHVAGLIDAGTYYSLWVKTAKAQNVIILEEVDSIEDLRRIESAIQKVIGDCNSHLPEMGSSKQDL